VSERSAPTTTIANQRRRALYAALLQTLPDDATAISVAFRLWQREFADLPHFVATRYVTRCAGLIGLTDAQRIALTRSIFESLGKPYDAMPRVPEELLLDSADADDDSGLSVRGGAVPRAAATKPATTPSVTVYPPAPQSIASTAASVVFGAICRSLLAPVRAQARSQADLLRQIIDDALAHARVPETQRTGIASWCVAGAADEGMAATMSTPELRRIVHALYLAACDALGPVAADNLLAQSISRAQGLSAAVEFPPDQLL
jgi:hypothetical protein